MSYALKALAQLKALCSELGPRESLLSLWAAWHSCLGLIMARICFCIKKRERGSEKKQIRAKEYIHFMIICLGVDGKGLTTTINSIIKMVHRKGFTWQKIIKIKKFVFSLLSPCPNNNIKFRKRNLHMASKGFWLLTAAWDLLESILLTWFIDGRKNSLSNS